VLRPLCPRLCQLKRNYPGFQSGSGSLITTFKLKKRELVYLIEALKMFIPGANEKGALFRWDLKVKLEDKLAEKIYHRTCAWTFAVAATL
jgi:hypothetical protein